MNSINEENINIIKEDTNINPNSINSNKYYRFANKNIP